MGSAKKVNRSGTKSGANDHQEHSSLYKTTQVRVVVCRDATGESAVTKLVV